MSGLPGRGRTTRSRPFGGPESVCCCGVVRPRATLQHGATAARVGREFLGPLGTRTDAVLGGYSEAESAAARRFLTDTVEMMRRHRARVVAAG